jgi:acetyl-CoA C-acetyltransferase/acetyl-CoA acyltransferase
MGTDLAALGADELGRIAVSQLLVKTGFDPAIIDEVIFGCVGQPADSANIGRVIALRAGIPESVPAITVSRNCASGCEVLIQAWQKMCAGDGEVFIVGGTESMSNYPLMYNESATAKFTKLSRAKTAVDRLAAITSFRLSDFDPKVALKLGLSDPVCGLNMGQTAELIGREQGITRKRQDTFAYWSHRKALASKDKLAEEIIPVYVGPDFKKVVTIDNGPRSDTSIEGLEKLKPIFERGSGTVTAGNSSQVTDGAVAMLVMSERRAEKSGMTPLGVLSGYAVAGCDPRRMGLGPVFAIHRAEQRSGLKLVDADLIELNEAFAAQALAVMSAVKSHEFAKKFLDRAEPLGVMPEDRLNVNGGSIALGHPVGASGARLILTILKELARRKQKRGLVTLCVGGGQGAAVWLERTGT